MKNLLIAFAIFMLLSCSAEKGPYDDQANPAKEIKHALQEAQSQDKFILLNFGANWCHDCITLADQMHKSPLKELIEGNFLQIKVDIGEGDKNQLLVKKYGNVTKRGIPTIVVLDKNDKLLTGTLTGQLSNARNMGEQELYSFFVQVIDGAKSKLNQ